MSWKRNIKILLIIVGILLFLELLSRIVAEVLWFQEVGYIRAFLLRLITQSLLWIIVSVSTAWYLLKNLSIAEKHKYPHPTSEKTSHKSEEASIYLPYILTSPPVSSSPKTRKYLKFRWFLILVIAISLLLTLLLAHYGQIAIYYIQFLNTQPVSATPINPILFQPEEIWQLGQQIVSKIWYVGIVTGITIALLIYPRFLLTVSAILLSITLGMVFSAQWGKILQYFYSTSFNNTDPLFVKDIGFYIFNIPVWELLEFWAMGLFLYSLIAVTLTYLLSGDSISQGFFPGFSSQQQRHLCANGGLLMLVVAFSYWLSRYELLYSPRGVTFGASYTDVTAQLPAYNILSFFALIIAAYLIIRAIYWRPKFSFWRITYYGLGTFVILSITGIIVPIAVQYLIVQPNELAREQTYIQRTIALTRRAFNLDTIAAETFNPQGQLTQAAIAANDLTIRNIRLWDKQPLLQTNRQLQQIRLYYQFPDADIDRYTLQTDVATRRPAAPQQPPEPNLNAETTERRQVLIAARELDYNAVPQQAQTWINRHLIYTHGYGFTLTPVNVVGAGGLPEYFVKDIGGSEGEALSTSSESIRASIPIGQPRIYFGEITNTYVMTGTRVREFDYPSGSENVYNVYSGQGGISIGSLWQKLVFATYFKDWRILLTREFLPQTEILFRRNIKDRIRAIAPFLRYDSDPYLVTVDKNPLQNQSGFPPDQNYLYWIVDAYTTSERYPYSDPSTDGINYIRNSVKVVIDAYNGSVNFYIADASDPVIASWQKIFPNMFKPLNEMPTNLIRHIRYPVDFFKIQSERLMTYHMTDTQVFYNREDQWQIPQEIYGSEPRPVEPYYLITSLPSVPFEEFILLLPYTPRGRTNLIAWLGARADGENYGKLILYEFPKERLIYGPEQIEARINQDPIISQQISLWNRQGSRVIQGNLLIIPIEQSLLYVEPIYLEATQNSLPTLVRVVVAYENRIVMTQTLQQALQAIFQPETTPAPPIIRPLEEPAPS
ncbi:MAG: UPF0182 family protein [Calothrix sp. C42_A2020_038]|nr:UPF0182 family protein [Calothrix sp. C42_A2020_038]